MRRSLIIHCTAKPKSNWSASIVRPRLSICQLWAAPWLITSSTTAMSRPAFSPKAMPSLKPCRSPAMQIWLTIFASWPDPAGPTRVTARA